MCAHTHTVSHTCTCTLASHIHTDTINHHSPTHQRTCTYICIHQLIHVTAPHQEVIDDVEDGDNAPYDMYSVPDPEHVKAKAEKRKQEEESQNTKLLGDTLEELSGDEAPPPVPDQKFQQEKDEKAEAEEAVEKTLIDAEEEEASSKVEAQKPVAKIWPPPEEKIPDRPDGPKSGSANVLKKWPPANGGNSIAAQQLQRGKPPVVINKDRKWPPLSKEVPEKKSEPVREALPTLKPVEPKQPVVEVKPPPKVDEPPKKMFAVLKPVKRDTSRKEEQTTELSQIKLKKAENKKVKILLSSDCIYVYNVMFFT